MTNEKVRSNALVDNVRYSYAAAAIREGMTTLEEQVAVHSAWLVESVLQGDLRRSRLKQDVKEINKLDGMLTRQADGDITMLCEGEVERALAIRLAHHSGKAALELVGSDFAQSNYIRQRDTLKARTL